MIGVFHLGYTFKIIPNKSDLGTGFCEDTCLAGARINRSRSFRVKEKQQGAFCKSERLNQGGTTKSRKLSVPCS